MVTFTAVRKTDSMWKFAAVPVVLGPSTSNCAVSVALDDICSRFCCKRRCTVVVTYHRGGADELAQYETLIFDASQRDVLSVLTGRAGHRAVAFRVVLAETESETARKLTLPPT